MLPEVTEIICLQITVWAHGNVRPPVGAGGANVELVRAQKSNIKTRDDLAAILTADTEERRVGGNHRIRNRSPGIRFPLLARCVDSRPGGNRAAALLSCRDLGWIYAEFFFFLIYLTKDRASKNTS